MRFEIKTLASLSELGIFWDSQNPGFGLRITKGSKTFIYKYRTETGTQRWLKLGRYGYLTLVQAREQLQKAKDAIREGRDPAQDKKDLRQSKTVADYCDLFMDEHVKPNLRIDTVICYERLIRLQIKPILGKVFLKDLMETQVRRAHLDWQISGNRNANHAKAVLSAMCARAEHKWKVIPRHANPCQDVKDFETKPRQRYLTRDELPRIFEEIALREPGQNYAIAAIKMLLFTGARKSEIVNLQWDEVFLEADRLILKPGRAKETKKAKIIVLNKGARKILEGLLPLQGCPWVFPGQVASATGYRGHTTMVDKIWREIRGAAGAIDVHIHDLRHTMATIMLRSGANVAQVQAAIGHGDLATTLIYTHVDIEDRKTALDLASDYLEKYFKLD